MTYRREQARLQVLHQHGIVVESYGPAPKPTRRDMDEFFGAENDAEAEAKLRVALGLSQ